MAWKELDKNELIEEKKFSFISGIDRFAGLYLADELVKKNIIVFSMVFHYKADIIHKIIRDKIL